MFLAHVQDTTIETNVQNPQTSLDLSPSNLSDPITNLISPSKSLGEQMSLAKWVEG